MKRRARYVFVFGALALACMYWSLRAAVAGQLVFSAPLSWLGLSFLIIAIAYATTNPRFLTKRSNGTLSPFIGVLLLPYTQINYALMWLLAKSSKESPADLIDADVYLGRRLFGREVASVFPQGVNATVDLTSEFSEPERLRAGKYLCIPTLDTLEPTLGQLQEAAAFIEQHRKDGPVYVHCAMGHGRSATVVAAWLMTSKSLNVQGAIDFIKAKRPGIGLHDEQRALLGRFAEANSG